MKKGRILEDEKIKRISDSIDEEKRNSYFINMREEILKDIKEKEREKKIILINHFYHF